jgi:hypothetical protein
VSSSIVLLEGNSYRNFHRDNPFSCHPYPCSFRKVFISIDLGFKQSNQVIEKCQFDTSTVATN